MSYWPNVFGLVFFFNLSLNLTPLNLVKAPQIGYVQPAQVVALNVGEHFLGL